MVLIRASGPPLNAALILLCAGQLAVGRQPGEGHVGVPGDRQRGGSARRRIDVDDLDGVAPLPTGIGGIAELLGLRRRLTGPAVGADQQHVVGLPVGGGHARRARGWRRPCSIRSGSSRSPARRRRAVPPPARWPPGGAARRVAADASSPVRARVWTGPRPGRPRMGPGNSGSRPGRGDPAGRGPRGRPVEPSEERPVGRDPLGVGGSEGGTGIGLGACDRRERPAGRWSCGVLRRRNSFPRPGPNLVSHLVGGAGFIEPVGHPRSVESERDPGGQVDRGHRWTGERRWRRGSPGRWRPGWRRTPR